jgi:hypothetical protein
MDIQLIDDRLRGVLPEAEFDRLKCKTETLYCRLHNQLATNCQNDLCDLLLVMRDLETQLTDRCVAPVIIRQKSCGEEYQGTMATLA